MPRNQPMTAYRHIALMMAIASAVAANSTPANTSAWEPVRQEVRDAKSVVKDDDIEIFTMPSCIIVNSSKKIQIRVFTILGRLVSEDTLQPGVSRLSVGAHGVYIIKAGELTCKVAV